MLRYFTVSLIFVFIKSIRTDICIFKPENHIDPICVSSKKVTGGDKVEYKIQLLSTFQETDWIVCDGLMANGFTTPPGRYQGNMKILGPSTWVKLDRLKVDSNITSILQFEWSGDGWHNSNTKREFNFVPAIRCFTTKLAIVEFMAYVT